MPREFSVWSQQSDLRFPKSPHGTFDPLHHTVQPPAPHRAGCGGPSVHRSRARPGARARKPRLAAAPSGGSGDRAGPPHLLRRRRGLSRSSRHLGWEDRDEALSRIRTARRAYGRRWCDALRGSDLNDPACDARLETMLAEIEKMELLVLSSGTASTSSAARCDYARSCASSAKGLQAGRMPRSRRLSDSSTGWKRADWPR